MGKKWQECGSIRMGKTGKLYIKLDSVKDLTDGCFLQIEKPTEEVERLIELGFIKENEVEERRAKAVELEEWLKYKLKLAPSD